MLDVSSQMSIVKRGFTLLELIVVIAIIGVLASAIYVAVRGNQVVARDARRKDDLRTISIALDQFFVKNGSYPSSLDLLVPELLSKVPTTPLVVGGYGFTTQNYLYFTGSSKSKYLLATEIENKNETNTLFPASDATTCSTSSGAPRAFISGVCENTFGAKVYQVGSGGQ